MLVQLVRCSPRFLLHLLLRSVPARQPPHHTNDFIESKHRNAKDERRRNRCRDRYKGTVDVLCVLSGDVYFSERLFRTMRGVGLGSTYFDNQGNLAVSHGC